MRFFKDTHYEFVNKRKMAFTISLAIIAAGLISFIIHGGFNLSIDFAGGSILQLKFENPIPIKDIRSSLEGDEIPPLEITQFGNKNEVLIRFTSAGDDETQISNKILESLRTKYSDNTVDVRRIEKVGPKIGSELKVKAFWAVIFSMIGILIYVTVRFEFRFAIAAIIALFHDVLITLSIFSILNKEISLTIIAALLTIVGYSLNDTIVVFDRIREDLRSIRKIAYERVINSSINETLSRTVITSITTLVAVLALLLFGGQVIFDFSFALLVGVLIGTYSSIFIASPVLISWNNYFEKKKKK